MRAAVLSLIIAASLATMAEAQTPAQPTPAQPAPPAATPAPQAPATPQAAAPAPTLPTTGDGAAVISLLEKVCVPIVHGQSLDTVAKAAGLKANRRDGTWSMALGADRNYQIIVQPQFSNKNVCQAEVHYAVGQDKPIVDALNVWSFLHQPELTMEANYVSTDPDGIKRVRRSWEHADAHSSIGLNFSSERKPDDTPLDPHYDTGMLFYQERAL